MTARICILDIETAPNLAYVWGFFKTNIAPKMVLDHTTVMSFAYKWLDEEEVFYFSAQDLSEADLLRELVAVLDEADIVVAHNGRRFDLPVIQGRCLVNNIRPPSPYKIVDTLTVARYEFKFPANSLEYLAKVFGVQDKGGHKNFPGFELWAECLKGNPAAWDEMEEYNIQDIVTLEEVYLKMRPWMRRHPNVNVFEDEPEVACPKCASTAIHYRGYAHTNTSRYRRFVCTDCGGWGRTRYNIRPSDLAANLAANVMD